MQRNLPTTRKKFAHMKEEFRHRQKAALQRRLGPGKMTAKQLAYAIGVHADTILNWASGYSEMNGSSIEAVDEFFQGIGDWNFIAEIYGDLGVRRRMRAEQLHTQAAELDRQAQMLEGAAA